MCPAALFTIAETRTRPPRPSAAAGIKTTWHLCTVGCFSAIKKKEAMPLAAAWTDLEIITLSEVGQRKTNTIPLTCGRQKLIEIYQCTN